MTYFIYKITPGLTPATKKIEYINDLEAYKEARSEVRSLRAGLNSDDATVFKIIFANNQLEAEERLSEVREAPVLKEWEK